MNIARRFVQIAPPPKAPERPVQAPKPAPAPKATKSAKRGPKPSGKAKTLITLRLDPDVVSGFRETGKGWQARMNEALRKALNI